FPARRSSELGDVNRERRRLAYLLPSPACTKLGSIEAQARLRGGKATLSKGKAVRSRSAEGMVRAVCLIIPDSEFPAKYLPSTFYYSIPSTNNPSAKNSFSTVLKYSYHSRLLSCGKYTNVITLCYL